jgi:snRNA-activating protein complex subunit 3
MFLFLYLIDFQSNCIEKVKEVVRIKQKQEEEKAEVRLHSFELVL